MTPKEEIRRLIREIQNSTYAGSPTQYNLKKALTLLDKIDDRAGEMEAFVKEQFDIARNNCQGYSAGYWQGRYEMAADFWVTFLKKESEPLPTITAREWHDYE